MDEIVEVVFDDSDTIKVIMDKDKATILYSVENEADCSRSRKWMIRCNHESWDGKKRDIRKLDTFICKICTTKCCSMCQFDGYCQKHRPFVSISPDGHGKKIAIYGYPEDEVHLKGLVLRDVFRMDVEVKPLR